MSTTPLSLYSILQCSLLLSPPPIARGLGDCWELSQCKQTSWLPMGATAPALFLHLSGLFPQTVLTLDLCHFCFYCFCLFMLVLASTFQHAHRQIQLFQIWGQIQSLAVVREKQIMAPACIRPSSWRVHMPSLVILLSPSPDCLTWVWGRTRGDTSAFLWLVTSPWSKPP